MGWIASSSEHKFTRSSGGGQFHKFGAVEKFLVTDFSHRHGSSKFLMKSFPTALERTLSTGRRNPAEIRLSNFHSGRTGNAENPVSGLRFLVSFVKPYLDGTSRAVPMASKLPTNCTNLPRRS
jgi:hypothetical protein